MDLSLDEYIAENKHKWADESRRLRKKRPFSNFGTEGSSSFKRTCLGDISNTIDKYHWVNHDNRKGSTSPGPSCARADSNPVLPKAIDPAKPIERIIICIGESGASDSESEADKVNSRNHYMLRQSDASRQAEKPAAAN